MRTLLGRTSLSTRVMILSSIFRLPQNPYGTDFHLETRHNLDVASKAIWRALDQIRIIVLIFLFKTQSVILISFVENVASLCILQTLNLVNRINFFQVSIHSSLFFGGSIPYYLQILNSSLCSCNLIGDGPIHCKFRRLFVQNRPDYILVWEPNGFKTGQSKISLPLFLSPQICDF
jgi:hypothetical protein